MAGGERMNVPAYLAIVALIAMIVFYGLEERLQQLAPLGFCVASLVVAFSVFALGRWLFAVVAVGFAVEALRRWYVRRGREHRV
jgi:hypothetical protein